MGTENDKTDDDKTGWDEAVAQMKAIQDNLTMQCNAIQDNFAMHQKQFCDAMEQQQKANKDIQDQLKKLQEEGRLSVGVASSKGGAMGASGERVQCTEKNGGKDPSNSLQTEANGSKGPSNSLQTEANSGKDSTGNAVDRLAAVLEKQFMAPQQSTRLPSLTLPKLIKSNNNQIVGTNFFSFKKRCLQFFAEHHVGESIAIHLLQTEESLPQRFRQSLNNCSTIKGCFQTMESMTEPLTAVYPQLIKELCSVDTAFDNDAQIKLCDTVCRILLQMCEHYPGEDIQIAHVTAVLSAFGSQHEINTLPNVVASFQQKHATTDQKFTTLLYNHCTQRRTDLYSIMAALELWRKDDQMHNLIQTSVEDDVSDDYEEWTSNEEDEDEDSPKS